MKNRDPNRSRQGREFDVEGEPMDWLDLLQIAAGWLGLMSCIGLVASAAGWLK